MHVYSYRYCRLRLHVAAGAYYSLPQSESSYNCIGAVPDCIIHVDYIVCVIKSVQCT